MSDLEEYVDFLWDGLKGAACIVRVTENSPWEQKFFVWPEERSDLLTYVRDSQMDSKHIYATPALFKRKSRKAEDFHVCQVTWADYDQGLKVPIKPDYTVLTSPGKFHAYWKLAEPVRDPRVIEQMNRSHEGHDPGAVDRARVLRVPGTINGKSGFISRTVQLGGLHYTPAKVQSDFYGATPPADRSGALYALGRALAEGGAERDECERYLREADSRWDKFQDRNDGDERIASLIERCYSSLGRRMGSEAVPIYSFRDFLEADEPDLEWVLENLLYREALGSIIGPSGVGKTQLVLRLVQCLVRRDRFLKWDFIGNKSEKVLFLSYEMNRAELLPFLQTMNFSEADIDLLQKGFEIYAPGYAHDWLDLDTQEATRLACAEGEYTGVIVDSLGSTTFGSLKDDGDVKRLLDFADRLRREFHVWVLLLHHVKKDQLSKTEMRDLDATFGSSYIGNRIRTSLMMLPHSDTEPDLIRISTPKLTHAPKMVPFYVRRTNELQFEVVDDQHDIPTRTEKPRGRTDATGAREILRGITRELEFDDEEDSGI